MSIPVLDGIKGQIHLHYNDDVCGAYFMRISINRVISSNVAERSVIPLSQFFLLHRMFNRLMDLVSQPLKNLQEIWSDSGSSVIEMRCRRSYLRAIFRVS